jgi:hypothetical protein
LELVGKREAAVAESDQWKPAFAHRRSRCICGKGEHSLDRGKHLNAMLGRRVVRDVTKHAPAFSLPQ